MVMRPRRAALTVGSVILAGMVFLAKAARLLGRLRQCGMMASSHQSAWRSAASASRSSVARWPAVR